MYISRSVPFVLRREAEDSEGIRSGRWTNQAHTGCDLSHSLLHLFYTHPGVSCGGMCDLELMVALALTCIFDLHEDAIHKLFYSNKVFQIMLIHFMYTQLSFETKVDCSIIPDADLEIPAFGANPLGWIDTPIFCQNFPKREIKEMLFRRGMQPLNFCMYICH